MATDSELVCVEYFAEIAKSIPQFQHPFLLVEGVEQMLLCELCFPSYVGDYVFVRSDQSRPYIARIDRMWTDRR